MSLQEHIIKKLISFSPTQLQMIIEIGSILDKMDNKLTMAQQADVIAFVLWLNDEKQRENK